MDCGGVHPVQDRLRASNANGVDQSIREQQRTACEVLNSNERGRLIALEREIMELRRANKILKTASAFF